jgi:hypothetical protein
MKNTPRTLGLKIGLTNFEFSWLKTFALYKVVAFGIMLFPKIPCVF